jgi:hypothetical protein
MNNLKYTINLTNMTQIATATNHNYLISRMEGKINEQTSAVRETDIKIDNPQWFYKNNLDLNGIIDYNQLIITLKDVINIGFEHELFKHKFRVDTQMMTFFKFKQAALVLNNLEDFKNKLFYHIVNDKAIRSSEYELSVYKSIISEINSDNLIHTVIYLFTLNGSLYEGIDCFIKADNKSKFYLHYLILYSCLSYKSINDNLNLLTLTTSGYYVLYRPLRVSSTNFTKFIKSNKLSTKLFSEDFIVTTYNLEKALIKLHYLDKDCINCLFEFHIPKDKAYLFTLMDEMSFFPFEKQAIIHGMSVFKVNTITKKDNIYYFKLNLISEKDNEYEYLKFTKNKKLNYYDEPKSYRTRAILKAIKINKCLTELKLGCDSIDSEDCCSIINHFQYNRRIVSLVFRSIALDSNNFKHISKMLDNSKLKQLSIDSNNSGPTGLYPITLSLLKNKSLLWLDLSKTSIGVVGSKHIVELLKFNKTLQNLAIASNNLLDEGVKYIIEAMAYTSSLKRLVLADNNITEVGAKYISDGLKVNQTLTCLDISCNKIKDVGVKHIAQSL